MSDLDDGGDYWEDGTAESTLKEGADNGKEDASFLLYFCCCWYFY